MQAELERIKRLLKEGYFVQEDHGLTDEQLERYAKVLLHRAVSYLLDFSIDSPTIEEDLYREDGELVNLEYSEEGIRRDYEEESRRSV